MKILRSIAKACVTVALTVFCASGALGQAFSGAGSTNATGPFVSTNGQYFVIPPGSGAPIVQFVEATLAGSEVSNSIARVQFLKPVAEIVPQAAQTNSATTITSSTNGLAANDVVIFWNKPQNTFYRLTVASLSGSTITFNETLLAAVSLTDKDRFYRMTVAGKIAGGNAATHTTFLRDRIQVIGPHIWAGGNVNTEGYGWPNVVEVFGTNSPTLNAVSGRYGVQQ